jgi:acylphosphatase
VIALNVRVEGRVQGVGFRAFIDSEARRRGLLGWVRNRADGSVEAVFGGEEQTVREMIEACRKGPRAAIVRRLTETQVEVEVWRGFSVLPTV